MRAIDMWCSQNAIECLYFLARSSEPSVFEIAQTHGFDLVDIRVTYSQKIAGLATSTNRHPEVLIRPVELTDIPKLQEIARYSHTDSRFYADKHFPRNLCDALYDTWIARSCTGYADAVLVAESRRAPVGYISCHLDTTNKHGSIGLVGVDEQTRGQGIGQALVKQALEWFLAQRMLTVTVVTQGRNIAAQRLYQKNGFFTESMQLWYHKWYRTER